MDATVKPPSSKKNKFQTTTKARGANPGEKRILFGSEYLGFFRREVKQRRVFKLEIQIPDFGKLKIRMVSFSRNRGIRREIKEEIFPFRNLFRNLGNGRARLWSIDFLRRVFLFCSIPLGDYKNGLGGGRVIN